MATLVERLETLKQVKNVLQKDVAQGVGLSLRTYQRYEYGEREPSASMLIALANYFDVSVDYLLGLSDDPQRR